MTVSLTHAFVSAKGDGTDNTQVQPSNWNAQHTLTCAGNTVLGNSTSSNGAATDIACTAQGRTILAAGTVSDLIAAGIPLFSTGDIKLTLKTVADTGWVMFNDGTIGNSTSGATFADPSAQNLYELIWNNVADAYAPVTGGRGASAAADWAAEKPIQLLKTLGRALAIAGSGSGLSSRALGQTVGEENHTLSQAELPVVTPTITINDPGHHHTIPVVASTGTYTGPGANGPVSTSSNTGTSTTGITATCSTFGSGSSHNNMQPSTFLNAMCKL